MVNSLAPRPKMKPSLLNSMAAEATALANPVMGTRVPAPANLAIRSNTPMAVRVTAMKMRVIEVRGLAISSIRPMAVYKFPKACPKVQMAPPMRKALRQSLNKGEEGEAFFTICLYSLGEGCIRIIPFCVFVSIRKKGENMQKEE